MTSLDGLQGLGFRDLRVGFRNEGLGLGDRSRGLCVMTEVVRFGAGVGYQGLGIRV